MAERLRLPQVVKIPIRAWMVAGLVCDFVEEGFVRCFSESLFEKLLAAEETADADRCPDVWLDLDEWEVAVLYAATDNCALDGLPRPQRDRLSELGKARWEQYLAETTGNEEELPEPAVLRGFLKPAAPKPRTLAPDGKYP